MKLLDSQFGISELIPGGERPVEETLITKRLKEIRKSKSLTLERLAALTDLSKSYLSEIENSDLPPPIYTLSRISKALGIDIADLFDRTPAVVPYQTIVVGRGNEHQADLQGRLTVRVPVRGPRAEQEGQEHGAFHRHRGLRERHRCGEGFQPRRRGAQLCPRREHRVLLRRQILSHLEAGDHVYFDADKPHSARSIGDKKAKVLIVMYSYKRL